MRADPSAHSGQFRQDNDAHMTVQSSKPVETFPCRFDPLTGWEIEPAPTYRKVIPVYDADTLELREHLP